MTDPKPTPRHDLHALLGTVRAHRPDTSRLEYGFETRLLARLREERSTSVFAWAWRLCPYFAALAVAAAFWSRTTTAMVQREAPVWVEAAQTGEEQTLVAYMTGQLSTE
jgi:hypothetical protein